MASGGSHNHTATGGKRSKGKTSGFTFAAPQVNDEELAKKLQAEEDSLVQDSDRLMAEHLQEQHSRMSMYINDGASARRAEQQEKDDTIKADEDLAREISDKELAYKLQLEMDAEFASQLESEESSKETNGATAGDGSPRAGTVASRRRLRGFPVFTPTPAQTTGLRDEVDHGDSDPYVDNEGTMFLPESMLPFFSDSRLSATASVHPAFRRMRTAFSDDQWASIQVNPLDFLLHMMHGAPNTVVIASDNLDGEDYESLWDLAERLGEARNPGLSSDEIDVLPTSNFSGDRGAGDSEDNKDCKVCLTEFTAGDTLRTLPCCHRFHKECIDKWMKRKAVCPVCRLEVKESLAPTASGS